MCVSVCVCVCALVCVPWCVFTLPSSFFGCPLYISVRLFVFTMALTIFIKMLQAKKLSFCRQDTYFGIIFVFLFYFAKIHIQWRTTGSKGVRKSFSLDPSAQKHILIKKLRVVKVYESTVGYTDSCRRINFRSLFLS